MQHLLFMNAPTAMLLIDPTNNLILQANDKGQELFDLNNDEAGNILKAQPVSAFFPDCLEQLIHFTQQVLIQKEAWTSNLSIKVNNQTIHLEINASKVDENILMSCQNSVKSFARYHQAIVESNYQSGLTHWRKNETAFEEIERQNQLLLTAVGDGIYGVDAQGNTTFVNLAAEQIIGWIHSVDDEVFWAKDGTPVPVEYTSTPVTEHGILIGAVVIFRDITDRKRIQEKLLNAIDEIDSLKRRLEMENAYLLEELNADFNYHQIIGQSAQVQHMVQQIELVGPTNANVLIIGESGTGKELIARAIHEVSERKARPLIRVNCAAIPADLFESEFFGHVKGAFSGAISDRVGRFELADGATIFLDEVGEIPIQLQGKLLRVLQEQQFERVGDSKTRSVDLRVISATNQDLRKLIKENKFREDLYYRLNVFPIQSPALRDRIDDLPLLAKHFIDKVCTRINKPQPKISLAQMHLLEQYSWPGNIRELENIIERQIILAKDQKINFDILTKQNSDVQLTTKKIVPSELMSAIQHKALEKTNIEQALLHCNGKIYGADGAAELLGLKPTTLASKIKKYEINRHHHKI